MAFDDLSIGEYKLLLELIESQLSGKYSSKFDLVNSSSKGLLITLKGINGNEDKEIIGFTEGDWIKLAVKNYLASVQTESGVSSSLSHKGFEHYVLRDSVSRLFSPDTVTTSELPVKSRPQHATKYLSAIVTKIRSSSTNSKLHLNHLSETIRFPSGMIPK